MTTAVEALIAAIRSSLAAVEGGRPFDCEAWITLEENLGRAGVEWLWQHPTLGPVGRALDYYCHSAQHDRDIVFGDLRMDELKQILLQSVAALERETGELPIRLMLFA